ncbi:beta-lactamase family protein [Balneolaceae bacterium YR4-1]|uniref:Beta-lactamase family protein n=1 Tax=Halalkalibaculum roseum TaxID=2709311 RepID=A0A6M1SJT2_9BACT|nr:serine hydrolase domain-containing protein [Halalkalibaculum roseum]NGP75279.1 beta-lactamase family protein [Halalkalibaculum roseum]
MRTTLPILLFILYLVSCTNEDDKNPAANITTRIDTYIQKEQKDNFFSGTVTVSSGETTLFSKATGIADRSWDIPMQPDYHFDIASINKSFIVALILLAVEEEKVSLQDNLTDLLSGYTYSGQYHKDITIHQMLSHTSGLPDYDSVEPELSANEFLRLKRMHFNNAEYVDFISNLKPADEPGEKFYYSNFSYHLLAIILEDIYESEFNSLLQEKISRPLNLSNTYSETSRRKVHQEVAEGYTLKDGEWLRNDYIDLSLGRRIFSTSRDLYRWALAMDDTTFLRKESLRLMKTNHLQDISNRVSYGYGWVIHEDNTNYEMGKLPTAKPYIIHGGSTGGYKSILVNLNNGEWIISILSNSGNQTDELKMAQDITTILEETHND